MEIGRLKQILEAALLAAARPLAIADFESLFVTDGEGPSRDDIRSALGELASDWESGSLVLQQVASGYRAQVRAEFEPWIRHLWDEKPPRYSRALLETLAIIAYRQPITRPEIEDIRGVSISTQIMRTLQEREWVRVVGHREAPGKPAMFGTTRQFLDYFNLKSLDQLPPVSEIRDLESRYPELAFESSGEGDTSPGEAQGEDAPAAVEADNQTVETTETVLDEAVNADQETDADSETDPAAETAGDEETDPDEGARPEETAAVDSESDHSDNKGSESRG